MKERMVKILNEDYKNGLFELNTIISNSGNEADTSELLFKFVQDILSNVKLNNEIIFTLQKSSISMKIEDYLEFGSEVPQIVKDVLVELALKCPFEIDERTYEPSIEKVFLLQDEMENTQKKLSCFFTAMEKFIIQNVQLPYPSNRKNLENETVGYLFETCNNYYDALHQFVTFIDTLSIKDTSKDYQNFEKGKSMFLKTYWHFKMIEKILTSDFILQENSKVYFYEKCLNDVYSKFNSRGTYNEFSDLFNDCHYQMRLVLKAMGLLENLEKEGASAYRVNLIATFPICVEGSILMILENIENSSKKMLISQAIEITDTKFQEIKSFQLTKQTEANIENLINTISHRNLKSLHSEQTLSHLNSILKKLYEGTEMSAELKSSLKSFLTLEGLNLNTNGNNTGFMREPEEEINFQKKDEKVHLSVPIKREFTSNENSFLSPSRNSEVIDINNTSRISNRSFISIYDNFSDAKLAPKKFKKQKPTLDSSSSKKNMKSSLVESSVRNLASEKISVLKLENEELRRKRENALEELQDERKKNKELARICTELNSKLSK